MSNRWLWVVALALTGCVAEPLSESLDEPEETTPAHAAPTDVWPDYTGPEKAQDPDPCPTGVLAADGHWVVIPVACNRRYLDTGDPPPEAVTPGSQQVENPLGSPAETH